MITEYNKLVRDKIPAIIAKKYKKPNYEVINNRLNLYALLLEKLQEEFNELKVAAKNKNKDAIIEELADVNEVLKALKNLAHKSIIVFYKDMVNSIMKLKNIKPRKVYKYQKKKRKEKGAFKKGIFLISVED